jgi:Fic family protein
MTKTADDWPIHGYFGENMTFFYSEMDFDIKTILLAQIRNIWTHASTAIEGNSLTLGDTAFILEEGLTVSGKPLRDHQEVYGHAKGIELIYRFLDSERLETEDILTLHRVVLSESVTDIFQPVGMWKKEANFTSYIGQDGKQHWRQFPDPENIPLLMRQWLDRFNAAYVRPLDRKAVSRAYADLHLDFVTVHPFFDGNGRMARLLSNLPVLRSGFPPIVVPAEARQEYKKSISAYQETILALDRLKDLGSLPENSEKDAFRNTCVRYWETTMVLMEEAREMQGRRNLALSIGTQEKTREKKDHGPGS